MSLGYAITGLAVTHQAGLDVDSFWNALCSGRQPQSSAPGVIGLGQINAESFLSEDQARRMDRISQILAMTTRKAIDQAGKRAIEAPEKVGMCVSTDLGSINSIIQFSVTIFQKGPNRANPMDFPNTVMNAPAGHTCVLTGLKGHNNTLAGGGALSEAYDALVLERADAMVVAGLEETEKWQQQSPLLGYALAFPAPLSAQRAGCWLGEGAACLLMEAPERAQLRQARVWAHYLAHASAFKPGDVDGQILAEVIYLALQRAGISSHEIDGIVVSADGQVQADTRIASALMRVFQERTSVIPLYAYAGVVGNMAGATEVFGALCACLILAKKMWPASPWYEPDNRLPRMQIFKQAEPFGGKIILSVATDSFGVNHAHVFSQAK